METWYRTGRRSSKIETVQVTHRTPKYVTVIKESWDGEKHESREMINTSYSKYWQTIEEAKGYLLDAREKDVEYATERLDAAKSELALLHRLIESGDILKP